MSTSTRSSYAADVEFAVLGPLQVRGPAGTIDIVGAKERALLSHLVAAGGRMVSTDDLVDDLWAEDPPRTATKSLQNYVLHLRNVLEPNRAGQPQLLLTDGRGYRLAVADEDVDARRFARLVEHGRRAVAGGRLDAGAQTLAEALSLWRGPAYTGQTASPTCQGEARRLEELRIAALEDRIGADLDRGLARETIPELESLVHAHPLRERLWRQLVLALYRSGRQADSLEAYSRARAVLLDELGVEPGIELRGLHAQVLAQDPALAAPARADRLPRSLHAPSGPFVGRGAEMDFVLDLWTETLRGQGSAVVLRGPPGAGAHRLACEVARQVADLGHAVVHVTGTTPYPAGTDERTLVVVDAATASVPPADQTGRTMVLVLHSGATDPPHGAHTVDLLPLDLTGVAEVVASYVAAPVDDDTLERVLRESRGVPGRVHDSALALARHRTHTRLRRASDRTNVSHTELTQARDDLRDSVSQLQSHLVDRRSTVPGTCPWKGLASYEAEDAEWFCGRERLVAEMVSRLATTRLMVVVGSSGSGKSSLLRAGFLASLAAGALPGSETWLQVVMRPGRHPLQELVRVVLRGRAETSRDDVAGLLEQLVYGTPPDQRVVLVVDQLEELWTTGPDDAGRHAFLDALAEIVGGETRCTVVLAVRADYVGELADHAGLARAAADATVLVGAPTEAEMRQAVTTPAARAGLALDAALCDALVADAGAEPGALPLLSTALAELWTQRDGDRLALTSYVRSGGLRGAVARLAERAFGALDDADQEAARALLLRLAGPGEADAATRRRVPLAELSALPDPRVRAVVAPLADARLLTVGADHVEVAHEALFREWPRLRAWLVDDAEARAVQRRLVTAAAEWDAAGREDGDLWSGSRLVAAVDFALAHPREVTHVEQTFVDQAQAHQDAERRAAEQRATAASRQNRRLRVLLAGLAAVLVLAVTAGTLAVQSRSRAEREATVSAARALAAASVSNATSDGELAVLLALESVERARPVEGQALREAEEALHVALSRSRVVSVLSGVGERVDWSPDGSTVVMTGALDADQVDVRDAVTGDVRRSWSTGSTVTGLAVSPDGTTVATTGTDGAAEIWDAATGAPVSRLRRLTDARVEAPSFSPDGRLAAASWSDGVVCVWEVATGRQVQAVRNAVDSTDWSHSTAFSPDGTRIAFAFDGFPRIADVVTGQVVLDLPGVAYPIADLEWSPDGRSIAGVGADRYVHVWDALTGTERARADDQPTSGTSLSWSPDGLLLATGSVGGATTILRVSDQAATPTLTLSALSTRAGVASVDFSPDGRRLVVGSYDATATTWDLSPGGNAEVAAYPVDSGGYSGVDYSGDGDRILLGTGSGETTVRSTSTGEVVQHLGPHAGLPEGVSRTTYAVDLSPDGTLVAMTASDDTVSVYDAVTGEEVFTRQVRGWAADVAWSPDSRHLAAASWGNSVDEDDPGGGQAIVLDRDGRTVASRSEEADDDQVLGVEFSGDGRLLASVVNQGNGPDIAQLWDWEADEVVHRVTGVFVTMALHPDGRRMVLVEPERTRVVDIDSGTDLAVLVGHAAAAYSVAVSPDGSRVAVGHEDGVVRVWDTDSGRALTVLTAQTSRIHQLVFSPDSRHLATSDSDRVARVSTLDLDELVRIGEAEVTRGLTDDECRLYLQQDQCDDS